MIQWLSYQFDTGQPTRGGVQKSDQNPHHPPKGGVNANGTVFTRVLYACLTAFCLPSFLLCLIYIKNVIWLIDIFDKAIFEVIPNTRKTNDSWQLVLPTQSLYCQTVIPICKPDTESSASKTCRITLPSFNLIFFIWLLLFSFFSDVITYCTKTYPLFSSIAQCCHIEQCNTVSYSMEFRFRFCVFR